MGGYSRVVKHIMVAKVSLEPVERLPSDSRVFHYDELPDLAKDQLPCLLDSDEDRVHVSDRIGDLFEYYNIVKFTDYYCVTVTYDTTPLHTVC